MKNALLTVLRSKNTKTSEFRLVSQKLGYILAAECASNLKQKKKAIETPFGKATGTFINEKIVLLPILRAGMALLHPFLVYFEEAKIGFLGIKRDEDTALRYLYYDNIPKIKNDEKVVILEPMIATGGTANLALSWLIEKKGIAQENISVVSVIAAKIGFYKIKKRFPKVTLHVVAIDEKLNNKKFITPGLGDFGDRFFGTEL